MNDHNPCDDGISSLKIQLGCGIRPLADYVNHDRIKHAPHVDVAHDLNILPWPWADESAAEILALDVLEHLKLDPNVWLDECWRILRPGGRLHMRLPAWDNPHSYRDLTHRKVFHPESFLFWDQSSAWWENYGRFYYAESGRWWEQEHVERCNDNDLCFWLRKPRV